MLRRKSESMKETTADKAVTKDVRVVAEAYQSPTLTRLGRVPSLTTGGSTMSVEGMGGSATT